MHYYHCMNQLFLMMKITRSLIWCVVWCCHSSIQSCYMDWLRILRLDHLHCISWRWMLITGNLPPIREEREESSVCKHNVDYKLQTLFNNFEYASMTIKIAYPKWSYLINVNSGPWLRRIFP